MGNPIHHFEISVRDAKRSIKFYEQLFDWHSSDEEEYLTFRELGESTTPEGIGGRISQLIPGRLPPYATVYIDVDDVAMYLDKVLELGGEIVVMPTPVPDIGAIGVFADLDGNIIGLFSTNEN